MHLPAAVRRALAALAASACAVAAAQAQAQWVPDQVFVQGGRSARDTLAAVAGLRWDWERRWFDGRLSGATDLMASHWAAERGDGREGRTHVALVPMLRWQFSPGGARGGSPWFVEGGIGLSLHDSKYRTRDAQMGTTWNFYDVLAVGRTFGDGGRHELSLRVVHVSNGGVKKPNPGEDFLKLRYAARF